MNHPPAAAGGIYKARTCVNINAGRLRRLISGVSIAENASLDMSVNQWLTLPVPYRLTSLTSSGGGLARYINKIEDRESPYARSSILNPQSSWPPSFQPHVS